MKFIKGYENRYSIDERGNIFSFKSNRNLKHYKGTTESPYLRVCLTKEGKNKWFLLHRLLAFSFIPNTKKKKYVNHIDGNKLNNSLGNLEWCTGSENNIHSYRIGTHRFSRHTQERMWEGRGIVINKITPFKKY